MTQFPARGRKTLYPAKLGSAVDRQSLAPKLTLRAGQILDGIFLPINRDKILSDLLVEVG